MEIGQINPVPRASGVIVSEVIDQVVMHRVDSAVTKVKKTIARGVVARVAGPKDAVVPGA